MRFIAAFAAIGLLALDAPAFAASQPKLDDYQLSQAMDFAMHDAIFTLYHESGHMLIHEFHLPVLGKEEDAADALGVIEIVKNTPDPDELFYTMNDVANGWYYSSLRATDADLAAFDDHSTDIERANAMVCLMVGANADEFTDTADDFGLDDNQQEDCADTYQQALDSWDTELAPHGAKHTGKPIPVVYEAAGHYAVYRDELKSRKILENLALVLGKSFDLPDTISIHATQCDEANAFYDNDKHQIIYCYELADDMYKLGVANLFSENQDESGEAAAANDETQTSSKAPEAIANSPPSSLSPQAVAGGVVPTRTKPPAPAPPSGNSNAQPAHRGDGTR